MIDEDNRKSGFTFLNLFKFLVPLTNIFLGSSVRQPPPTTAIGFYIKHSNRTVFRFQTELKPDNNVVKRFQKLIEPQTEIEEPDMQPQNFFGL